MTQTKDQPETVAVLGAGNMGTALAQVIAGNGHAVRLWSIETDVLAEIRDHHTNGKYLGGVRLHDRIEPCWRLDAGLNGARLAVFSVPSQIVSSVARDVAPCLRPGQLVLNVAKGLEANTHLRMSEVLAREFSASSHGAVGSMGGPAIAIELARGLPMAVIVGMEDRDAARLCQRILQNDHLKVETTTDLLGVELCSSLKNVYAIALGMCDGLGFGTNTKAFLATLALEEMSLICSGLGGRRDTVYGLAGFGDLLTTGYSQHSRNRTLGEKLGSDGDWVDFLLAHTVEGVGACRALMELITGLGIRAHLLDTLHEVLFEERPAPDAMRHFFREFSYG